MATPTEHEQRLIDLAFRFKHGWIPLNPSVNEDTRGLKQVMARDEEKHLADLEATVTKPTTEAEYGQKWGKSMGVKWVNDDDRFKASVARLKKAGLIRSDKVDGQAVDHFNARGEKDPYAHVSDEETGKLWAPPGKAQVAGKHTDMTAQEIADWEEHKREVLKRREAAAYKKDQQRKADHPVLHGFMRSDLSNVDLAKAVLAVAQDIDLALGSITHLKPGQRYRHGWIPVEGTSTKQADAEMRARLLSLPGSSSDTERARALNLPVSTVKADEKNPYAGMRRLEAQWAKDGTTGPEVRKARDAAYGEQAKLPKGLLAALRKHHAKTKEARAEKRRATDRMIEAQRGKGGGKAGAQSEFDRAAKAARARRKAADLSTDYADPMTLDLASNWGAFNAKRQKKGVAGAAFKPTPLQRQVKAFRKSTGVKSIAGPRARAILANRASQPGHFRAKAILAAQNGNMAQAKKFEAKRAVVKARRMAAAPQPAKPHPAAVVRPPAPVPTKPNPTFHTTPATKPFKAPAVRGPRKIRK